MELQFISPEKKDGMKMVLVSKEDVSEEVKRLENTLIGFLFYSNFPSFDAMECFIDTHWRKYENVQVKLHSVDVLGVFYFDFNTVESKQLILERGPWTFEKIPLVLRPWTPDWSLESEELTRSALFTWIKLPHLKLHFWSPKMLSKIASMVGRPLFTDKLTAARERLSYARIYVKIYADEEQPDLVRIEDEKGTTYYQDVEYEWCPPKCSGCGQFGHSDVDCPYA